MRRLVLIAALAACSPTETPVARSELTAATNTIAGVIEATYPGTDGRTVAGCMTSQMTRDEIRHFAGMSARTVPETDLLTLAELLNRESTLNCIAAAEVELVPEDGDRL